MRTAPERLLAIAVMVFLGGCGGSSGGSDLGVTSQPDGADAMSTADGAMTIADSASAGDVNDVCSQCAATEICIQLDDSATRCRIPTPFLACQPISDACRAQLTQISPAMRSCFQLSAECQREFCPQPLQCVQADACGNESTRAQVWCYGAQS